MLLHLFRMCQTLLTMSVMLNYTKYYTVLGHISSNQLQTKLYTSFVLRCTHSDSILEAFHHVLSLVTCQELPLLQGNWKRFPPTKMSFLPWLQKILHSFTTLTWMQTCHYAMYGVKPWGVCTYQLSIGHNIFFAIHPYRCPY